MNNPTDPDWTYQKTLTLAALTTFLIGHKFGKLAKRAVNRITPTNNLSQSLNGPAGAMLITVCLVENCVKILFRKHSDPSSTAKFAGFIVGAATLAGFKEGLPRIFSEIDKSRLNEATFIAGVMFCAYKVLIAFVDDNNTTVKLKKTKEELKHSQANLEESQKNSKQFKELKETIKQSLTKFDEKLNLKF